jgi:hypothetical protein
VVPKLKFLVYHQLFPKRSALSRDGSDRPSFDVPAIALGFELEAQSVFVGPGESFMGIEDEVECDINDPVVFLAQFDSRAGNPQQANVLERCLPGDCFEQAFCMVGRVARSLRELAQADRLSPFSKIPFDLSSA